MSDVCFIVNPASRRGKRRAFLDRLRAFVSREMPQAELRLTEGPEHATVLARQAGQAGSRRIYSVGGDGTLNEVVNGVMSLSEAARPAVGVLASGTGGDFPRRLRELASFPDDFSWLSAPRTLRIDLGRAWIGEPGDERERYFINIADAGIAGEVVRRVNASRKVFGTLEYLRSTLQAGWSYRAPRVRIVTTRADGTTREDELDLLIAMAANSRYFGGGMCIAPEAELDDGKLFFMVAAKMPYLTLLRELRRVYRKERMDHPKIRYDEGTRLEIEALSGELAIDLDGEYLSAERILFEVVPRALEVLVPGDGSPAPSPASRPG